jgi:hypothetical protein
LEALKELEITVFRPEISAKKTTAVPKNILPPQRNVTAQELEKRHKKENEELNAHYDARMTTLRRKKRIPQSSGFAYQFRLSVFSPTCSRS